MRTQTGAKPVFPQCCEYLLEQVARHVSKFRRDCVFSAAAGHNYLFSTPWSPTGLLTHLPSPGLFSHSPLPASISSQFPSFLPSLFPFSFIFAKHNECVVVYMELNGCAIQVDIDIVIILRYTSGHWHCHHTALYKWILTLSSYCAIPVHTDIVSILRYISGHWHCHHTALYNVHLHWHCLLSFLFHSFCSLFLALLV